MGFTGENRVRIVAGPTASGKSSYALELADKCNGAIINADSLQIYNALPILTAQPTYSDTTHVPHYLYHQLPANEACNAPRWCEMAVQAIDDVIKEGKTPIVVGGTGFYLKTLIDGISQIPTIPAETRAFARQLLQMIGPQALHMLLQARDPITAARLHPNDSQRVLRAWEVIEATDRPLSEWQSDEARPPREDWIFDIVMMMPERDALYRSCDERLDKMVDGGALDEIIEFEHRLRSGQVPMTTACVQALGYHQLRAYLAGEQSKADALEQAKAETRQYAKRQTTWFRHQLKMKKNIARIETLH